MHLPIQLWRRYMQLFSMMLLLLLLTCLSLSSVVAARGENNIESPTMSTEPVGTKTPSASEGTSDPLVVEDKYAQQGTSVKFLNWKGYGPTLLRYLSSFTFIRNWFLPKALSPENLKLMEIPTPDPIDCTEVRKRLAWFLPYNCTLVVHSIHVRNLHQLEVGSVAALTETTLGVNLTHSGTLVSEVRFTVELQRNIFNWFGKSAPLKYSFKTEAMVQQPKIETAVEVLYASAGFFSFTRVFPLSEKQLLQRLVNVELAQVHVKYDTIYGPSLLAEDRSAAPESRIGTLRYTTWQRHVQDYVRSVLVAKEGPDYEFVMHLLETQSVTLGNWYLKKMIQEKKKSHGIE